MKNFGLGASKNSFSKGRTMANTGRDGETTVMDESFVFVEVLELGTT